MHGVLDFLGHIHIDDPTRVLFDFLDGSRQAIDGLGAQDKIHMRHSFNDFLPFLLGNTSTDTHHQMRIFAF